MHRPITRYAAVSAAVLACLAATAGGTALAGARAPATHRAATAAITAAAGRTVLTLPGAGRVLVSRGPDGAFAVTLPVRPDPHPATALTTLRLGGQDYAIPLAAVPDLGRGLDLSLFNVTALERAEQGGRVPVTLRYHGRVPAARTVTVTVKGTDLAGRPDNGDVVLLGNVDHPSARGTGFAVFKHGAAKFRSAPGTYWAVALFAQVSGRRLASIRMDVLPQFKVAGNTTADASAGAATSKVALTTPRPAVAQSTGITVVRAAPGTPPSGLGAGVSSLAETVSGAPLYVSPVSRQPSHGTLRAFADGQLTSSAGTGAPYAYTLNFADRAGTIGSQHFAATAANLATVSERYYQDQGTVGAWETLGGTPYQINTSVFSSLALPLHLPGRQVQYLSASPPTLWESSYFEYRTISAGQPPGGQTDAFRLLRGGQHLAQAWGEYPLHPGPDVSRPGTGEIAAYPSAARSGNMLNLIVTPFTDNQPGHLGDGFDIPIPGNVNQISGAYAIYQDGELIAHGNAAKAGGTASARLSSGPSVIRFVLSASRASTHYRLSPASVDEWTWRSRPEAGATIRAPWICPNQTQRCAVQPMITLDYGVAGLGLNGAAPAGPQRITVTAGHIQLAPSPAITGARAQVSLNGGKTWEQARVRAAGADRFRLTFTAPRSAQVSLRVTARDAAGNRLTEMILRAYRTAA